MSLSFIDGNLLTHLSQNVNRTHLDAIRAPGREFA